MHANASSNRFFEFSLLLLIVLFFLTLGVDRTSQIQLRMTLGFLLLAVFLFSPLRSRLFEKPPSKTLVFFSCLIVFELLRLLWGWSQLLWGSDANQDVSRYMRYVRSPLPWIFYLGFFSVSYIFFRSRERVKRLLWLSSFCSFFLVMNVLPHLIQTGSAFYVHDDGREFFLHPLFYFHESVSKYWLGEFAHSNYVGDLIALGLFPALGICVYALMIFGERSKETRSSDTITIFDIGVPAVIVGTSAVTIFLLFSRGTMACFTVAFLFFLLATLVKYPMRNQFKFVGLILAVMVGFLAWSGNLDLAWKEVKTLSEEVDSPSSLTHNIEGAKRSLRMFGAYPLWGVGVDGYSRMAEAFSSPDTYKPLILARFEAMCHYLHVLAEEGSGALLYYLFLLSFLYTCAQGFIKCQSRFQAIAALAIFSGVLMVFGHAMINNVLEHFSMSVLVYIFMGACLAILRSDFKTE